MIYNEPFKMSWEVKYCEIQNDEIVEVKGIPPKKYNPFDYYGKEDKYVLYRKFISVDENNNDEILEFIRLYGFLGLDSILRKDLLKEANEHLKETNERIKLKDVYMTTKEHLLIKWFAEKIDSILKTPQLPLLKNQETYWGKVAENPNLFLQTDERGEIINSNRNNSQSYVNRLNEYINRPTKEKINDIKIEIKRMKLISKLWDSISFKDIEIINKNILALRIFEKDEITRQYIINNFKPTGIYEQSLYIAKLVMHEEINQQIVHVIPYLALDDIHEFMNNSTKSSQGHWSAPDLLSAMYVMIYMDFVQGKMLRKCRNETCHDWLEIYGNDDRKIYCNGKCANTQGKRNSRRRK